MSMLSRLTLSTLLFATLAMGNTAWAATYYVDRNLPGSDNNIGYHQDAPFLTIAKCVATATNPGDTCLVKNGTYPEAVLMRASGTASNPITLKNFPGHRPVLDFGNTTDSSKLLLIKRAESTPAVIQYIVVEGLEITGGWDGIKLNVAENIILRRNYIHHNGLTAGQGILCGYCYAITIDRNIVAHNGTNAPGAPGHGMYIYGTGHVITNNVVYANYAYGIQIAGYAFSAAGATATRQAGGQAIIANNTLAYNNAGIVFTECCYGGSGASGTPTGNSVVENNLFYENIGKSGHPNGVNYAFGGGDGREIVRNNYSYSTAPRGLHFLIGSGYTQTNNICLSGCSLMATNPLMVNAPPTVPASPNFALTASSPATLYNGLNLRSLNITTDFTGVQRPALGAWGIGGYEGTSSDTDSPATPRNLSVQ